MKFTAHVPTEQFGYIGIELEGDAHDAVLAYQEVVQAFQGSDGIGIKELAHVVHEYACTGQIGGGAELQGRYSKNEALLVNEIKKLIRAKNK